MAHEQPDGGSPDAGERFSSKRLDRNWNELLQELRVVQTGTQVITGFLLAAVFQSRFTELDTFQLTTYLCLVVTSVLTTIVGLAPVSLHRYLFRKRAKEMVVAYADRFARLTLVGVAVTVVGIALLIFDFVLGRVWGITVAAAVALLLVVGWIIVPQLARADDRAADADAARH
ncbi:DUF6328 family protein [Microterricola viridarii]|uniref:DUF6328 family protein n=1 Tax=Microterricola viridarii TaxID=412690 RepID=UPI00101AD408|nr:DUF6328 family protein [Microterricola viridarii]